MRIAAITMCFNESDFLPIWLNHYGSVLGNANLYIIDDGSTDNSTQDKRILNLIKRKRIPLDETHRSELISYFSAELLKIYDCVIYTDVDEILVVDPNLNLSLLDYINLSKKSYITAIGLNVLKHPSLESNLTTNQHLFKQRKYVQFDSAYCKTLIFRIPIKFRSGFHTANVERQFDKNIFLFHLRAVDKEIAVKRHLNYQKILFSNQSLELNHDVQFRTSEEEYIKEYFLNAERFNIVEENFLNIITNEWNRWADRKSRGQGKILKIPKEFENSIKLNTHRKNPPQEIFAEQISIIDTSKVYESALEKYATEEKMNWKSHDYCPCGSGLKVERCHGKV